MCQVLWVTYLPWSSQQPCERDYWHHRDKKAETQLWVIETRPNLDQFRSRFHLALSISVPKMVGAGSRWLAFSSVLLTLWWRIFFVVLISNLLHTTTLWNAVKISDKNEVKIWSKRAIRKTSSITLWIDFTHQSTDPTLRNSGNVEVLWSFSMSALACSPRCALARRAPREWHWARRSLCRVSPLSGSALSRCANFRASPALGHDAWKQGSLPSYPNAADWK